MSVCQVAARSGGASRPAAAITAAISLKAPKKLPRILNVAEMQAILDACTRLRDRLFFALLHDSGCFSRGHRPWRSLVFVFAQLRG